MSFFPGQGQQHSYPPQQGYYNGPPQNYGPPSQSYGPPPQGYPPQNGYPSVFYNRGKYLADVCTDHKDTRLKDIHLNNPPPSQGMHTHRSSHQDRRVADISRY